MIHIFDMNYVEQPHAIAVFLVETSAGPVLVETGPHSTFPQLKIAVASKGYKMSDIRHVFITHIHLDHAGAAWAMAKEGATIYLHPFGHRHMQDPSKLYASAKRIYGDDMDRLWGDLQPIPEAQLRVVDHGEKITVGDHTFVAWYTPGHAVHHIAWQLGDTLFTGDVAGVCIENVLVQPPCPPPDIHLEDWEKSIALIKTLDVKRLLLTHFGEITDIDNHLSALQERIWKWANWIKPHWEAGESPQDVTPSFMDFTNAELLNIGATEAHLAQYDAANPAWMSVAGLMRYWHKREEQ